MHTMPSRRGFLAAASTLAASAALPALAQDKYPRGPIRLIVGLPPGGSADVCARAVAGGMEGLLKQPILVDNRPGGQFKISMQALLNAPADGQTLLYIYNSYAAVQVTEKLFNIERETVPIMKVGTTPAVLMVRADSPFKSLQDFIAHARAHPGKLSYSTFGPAGIEHIKMAEIAKLAGIQCLPVPYRGGPDAITALLGGEIDICLNASIRQELRQLRQAAHAGGTRQGALELPARGADDPRDRPAGRALRVLGRHRRAHRHAGQHHRTAAP